MHRVALTMLLVAGLAGQSMAQSGASDGAPDVRTGSRMSQQGPYRSRMRVLRDSSELAAPVDPESLLQSMDDNGYARALLLRRLAYDDVTEHNVDSAIARLEEALSLEALATPAQQQMTLNLATLYTSAGRHQEAVLLLEPWLRSHPDADAQIVFTYGLALVETGDYAQAARQLRRAIASRDPAPENWLRVLLFSQHKAADYRAAADTLQRLIDRAPGNRDYWLQLGGTLRAAGDAARAAAVLEQAAVSGLLSEPAHYLQLINAYLAADLPFDAADLLAGMLASGLLPPTAAHWTLLGHAWLAARQPERALAPLVSGAEAASDPAAWLEAARLQIAEQQWDAAVTSLERARRGKQLGARDGEALLLLGEAQYRAGDRRAARKSFAAAAMQGVVYRAAQAWLDYLDNLPAAGR